MSAIHAAKPAFPSCAKILGQDLGPLVVRSVLLPSPTAENAVGGWS